jgi:hypothetical protein
MRNPGTRGRRTGEVPPLEPGPVLSLLVFEAADCLMALPASEVVRLLTPESRTSSADEVSASVLTEEGIDLGEYFTGCRSEGPWLRWGRGQRSAWLRVGRVDDVVSCAIGALTPMPALLRDRRRTGAFWAAGVRGDDVFLVLDPARLGSPLAGERES